jgi:hypothetical protein
MPEMSYDLTPLRVALITRWAHRITPGLDAVQLSAVVMNRLWVETGQRHYVAVEEVARLLGR